MPAFHMLQERFSGPSPHAPSLADAMTPGSDARSPLPSSRHLYGSSSFGEQQQVGSLPPLLPIDGHLHHTLLARRTGPSQSVAKHCSSWHQPLHKSSCSTPLSQTVQLLKAGRHPVVSQQAHCVFRRSLSQVVLPQSQLDNRAKLCVQTGLELELEQAKVQRAALEEELTAKQEQLEASQAQVGSPAFPSLLELAFPSCAAGRLGSPVLLSGRWNSVRSRGSQRLHFPPGA